jgi:phenylalanyl-tRNA synthetase beta chain
VGLGLSEIVNYSFVSDPLLDLFDTTDAATRVRLPNPVSADHALLRNSLLPHMVETLGRNLSRQVADAAFFEMGGVFLQSPEGGIREEERLSIGLMGKAGRVGIGRRAPVEPEEAFLALKGVVEALSAGQHATRATAGPASGPECPADGRALQFSAGQHPALEDGWAVSLSIAGRPWGVMGLLKRELRGRWRMLEPVAVAEVGLDPLLDRAFEVPDLQAVPRFPSVVRDVALIVDDRVTHDSIIRTIWRNAPNELTRAELFDIFRGRGIGAGKKSLAYSLVYRSPRGNLTDEDANAYHATIKEALKRDLSAEIRES